MLMGNVPWVAAGTENEINVASPVMLALRERQVSGPRTHRAAVTKREIVIEKSLSVNRCVLMCRKPGGVLVLSIVV
jgi:hypothetical protein